MLRSVMPINWMHADRVNVIAHSHVYLSHFCNGPGSYKGAKAVVKRILVKCILLKEGRRGHEAVCLMCSRLQMCDLPCRSEMIFVTEWKITSETDKLVLS